jgi:arsenate reductase (thioredoxin)
MKILFVCHSNVGRSQMAKAFYNKLTNTHDADAAGTAVKEVGQTLIERKQTSRSKKFFLLDVMDELGYDLSDATRNSLHQGALSDYGWIISMALPRQSPDWLLTAPNYVFWDVKDPRGQDYETTARIRDEILERVKKLIETKSPN